jgi:hypothetical protein
MKKVVGLFKKKEGMSDEDFRDHYENHHAHLFNPYLEVPGIHRYARRYLEPMATPITGEVHSSGIDVIMEVWCDDKWYQDFFVNRPPEEFRQMIAEDEAKFFKRDEMQMYLAREYETDLAKLQKGKKAQ